ncbi:DUF2381 family protein [Vitiosangium sp. GDMCC 1.1324]|uniref:DUF2381 family protein n=1 Tax=Vitiosangium sp. (strain GDMCC 1.1324) TaxID=2138576 RepID=UPI00130DAE20|nr:DUF2381 family protein [Vitiosangium sp. GDMCC 1.1324]
MTLCVMLFLAMRVSAAGEEARPGFRKPRLRAVTVSGRVEEVRVAARTATRIRFDTAVDAARTRLEDERGRFEPLLLGNGFLVVTPREELSESEQVTLHVVLADGTQVPFALATSATEVDVQVRVSRPGPAPSSGEVPALVSAVWRERVRELRAGSVQWPEHPRFRRGEGHAGRLAESMLVLAARSEAVSPDVAPTAWHEGTGLEMGRRLFHAGALSGFVVRVRNPDLLRPWEPGDVRVRQADGGQEVEVLAIRMGPVSLPPGGWGWLVIVTRALPRDGQARFELELRGRSGASLAPPVGVAL